MNPVYVRALDVIHKNGIEHPTDFERAVELVGRLLDAGEAIDDHIDKISEHLKNGGMQSANALEVQKIYEVVHTLKKGTSHYTDAFIEGIVKGTP